MKTHLRCDHKKGDRQCPDSAGYRIRQLTFGRYARRTLVPGRFCLRHAFPAVDRIPIAKLPTEDR